MITFGKITILSVFLLSFGTGMMLIALWTVDDALNYTPTLMVQSFEVQETTAPSYVVFDVQTNSEIASKNPAEVMPIASITKLASASLFYKHAELQATTSITWSDVSADGEAGKLAYGDIYSHREIVYPLLIESSNDASEVLQRVYPNLVADMNAYAEELALPNTVFADASGLSNQNVSTAYELSALAQKLYITQPHIFDITRLSQFIGEHTGWINNNPFVAEEGYRGGKHGYTYAANKTAVAFFEEEIAGGVRTVGYVILGSDNLKEDMVLLRAEVRAKVSLK